MARQQDQDLVRTIANGRRAFLSRCGHPFRRCEMEIAIIGSGNLGKALGALSMQLQVRNRWPWRTAWKLLGPTG